jgi:hypothetical protein
LAVAVLAEYPTEFRVPPELIHHGSLSLQLAVLVVQAQDNRQDLLAAQAVVALGLVVILLPLERRVKVIPVAREVVVLLTLAAVEVKAQLAVQQMHLCKDPEVPDLVLEA